MRHLLYRALGRYSRAGAILCYHGIAEGDGGGATFQVTLAELQMAVGVARAVGRIVPLRELVERHAQGLSTAGLFAFTFDDAYLSLLRLAGEYLERERLPITVFGVPTALDSGSCFWWDRLDAIAPHLSPEDRRALFTRCGVPPSFEKSIPGGFGPERPLRQWILARHGGRWPAELLHLLHELERTKPVAATDRSMTWEELQRFATIPGVDIGVHTLTHPALPKHQVEEQRFEIEEAHRRLRERFPNSVAILAAPFGLIDAGTEQAARDAGMMATLSLRGLTLAGTAAAGALPRFCVLHSESPPKLALKLCGAVDDLKRWRSAEPPMYPPLPVTNTASAERDASGSSES